MQNENTQIEEVRPAQDDVTQLNEIKIILETIMLSTTEPLSVAELSKLFDDEIGELLLRCCFPIVKDRDPIVDGNRALRAKPRAEQRIDE